MAGEIGLVDGVLLAVLLLSIGIGLWRGLIFEVLSLLGWVAAYVAAQWFTPAMSLHLPVGTPGSAVNHAAAFACTFVLALLVWALLARLVRMLISASPLSGLDRLLGACFGVLRALVLMLAVTTAVAMTPAVHSSAWQRSHGVAWLSVVLQGLKPVLPVEVTQHLPV
jgi:membrane protein required for colicin V production